MVTTSEALAAFKTQYEVKVYIKNDSGTYVDFTSRFIDDDLVTLGRVSQLIHNKFDQPVTKSVKLTLDNSDRYWDDDAPAAFAEWPGKDVQLRVAIATVSAEEVLRTYRIAPNGIKTDDGPTATLALEPFEEHMRRQEAGEIRRGLHKYTFRSWVFLIQELIRSEFGDASGALPGSYSFPTDPRFTYHDGNKHYSVWGKPPQYDGTDWNDDNTDVPYDLDLDGTKLWVGIGTDLWEYEITTDTWTNRGEHPSNGNGTDIRYVYNIGDGVVVCKYAVGTHDANSVNLKANTWEKGAASWTTTTALSMANFSPNWVTYDGVVFNGGRRKGDFETPTNNGTNLIIPFPQRLYWQNTSNPRYSNAPLDSIHDSAPTVNRIYDATRQERMGWFSMADTGSTAPLELQINYGTRIGIEHYTVSASQAYFYLCVYDPSTQKGQIKSITINVGGSASIANVIAAGSINTTDQYLAPRISANNEQLVYIKYTEGTGSGAEDVTSVRHVDVSGALPQADAELFNNNDIDSDNYTYVTDILSLNYDAGTNTFHDIHMVCMEVDRLQGWPIYKIVHADALDTTPAFLDRDFSTSYFRGQKHAPDDDSDVYYMDTQTGAIKYIGYGDTSPTLVDAGRSPIYDAPFGTAAGFVVGSGADADMFGLSFPFHDPDTQTAAPEGKYYLWQYAAKHTGRVELADFDKLDKLQAVTDLANAFGNVVYVDKDGDWIVEERDPSGAAIATIKRDHFEKGWLRIGKKNKTDEQNFIEYRPYEVVHGAASVEINLKATSVFNGRFRIGLLDGLARRVRIRCIKADKIDSGRVQFDWLAFQDTIETRLGAAYASGTSVTVEQVWDVDVGDDIQVVDSEIREITAVDTATKVVTIDSGFSNPYAILSHVTITKKGTNQWSSLGVTTLAEALDASETGIDVATSAGIAVGNYIRVEEEEMQVTAIVGNTLTVVRGDNAVTHATALDVAAIILVSGLDVEYIVGGHKITLAITGATEPIENGDLVEVTSPGGKLQQLRHNVVRIADRTSVDDKGKRNLRIKLDNRFMVFQVAEFKLKKLVDRYKDAKRTFELTMPFDLDYALLDVVAVESAEVFPGEVSNQLDVIIREVHHSPMSNRTIYGCEEQ